MISIIVCSRISGPSRDIHERNVKKTIADECEYIRIDNTGNEYGLASAYNRGVDKARGSICVFMHEDAFFMEMGWGAALRKKFDADPGVGLVGVAGTQHLFAHDLRWHIAGRPYIRGRVIHELDKGSRFVLSVLSWDKADAEVVAVDGLFFAIRTELFNAIRFDADNFHRFHFYDLDICMQVRQTHRCIVTWDLLLKHLSAGKNDADWYEAAGKFRRKYRRVLPVSCVPDPPERINPEGAINYNIKGKAPQITII
ncbi:MAG: glycosyltransferase [Chitinivibrionales bacterium]|nr:glycosyltransferase [Chitinivibrionales bacterium]